MKVINFTDVRNNLRSVLDQVVEDADFTIITRRNADDTVVMSLDTFNSIMETFHLLKTPANADHLMKSLNQYKSGKITEQRLADD
jgi:antitoxin YefM